MSACLQSATIEEINELISAFFQDLYNLNGANLIIGNYDYGKIDISKITITLTQMKNELSIWKDNSFGTPSLDHVPPEKDGYKPLLSIETDLGNTCFRPLDSLGILTTIRNNGFVAFRPTELSQLANMDGCYIFTKF